MLLLLPAAVWAHAAREAHGGAKCTGPMDCQLNVRPPFPPSPPPLDIIAAATAAQGVCTAGACVCDPAWRGANCSTLNILPAKMRNGFGHLGSNRSSWVRRHPCLSLSLARPLLLTAAGSGWAGGWGAAGSGDEEVDHAGG